MFLTSEEISPMISSFSIPVLFGAWVATAAAAVTAAGMRAPNSLLISSSSRSAFLAAAVRMISKICSCVMLKGTCRVADESGFEEAAVWFFWDNCWLRCRIS